jgi:hypothetical protein
MREAVNSLSDKVLDLEAGETLDLIPVSENTQRIALSVDDRLAFTADQTRPQLGER